MQLPPLTRLKPVWSWLYGLLPVLAVAVAYRHVPWFGFIGDDTFLIPQNPRLHGSGALWQNLIHDYFWSASGNFLPYWRPVTKGSWVLEFNLWGGWPGGFHLDQLVLHLIATVGVVFLTRRGGASRAGACIAGLLFGLSPNLAEATCSVMARSDVAMTAASVWALAGWLEWNRTGHLRWGVAHVLALVLAFGSKETAMALPAVLALWTVLGSDDAAPPLRLLDRTELRRRLLQLVPVVAVMVAYFVGRQAVLGGQQGAPLTLDGTRVFLVGGQALFSVLPFHLEVAAHSVPKWSWSTPGALVTASLGWLALTGTVVLVIRKRQRLASGLVAWLVASLAPILLVSELNVPVSPHLFPLASRWVAPASAAAAALVGLALGHVPWRKGRSALYAAAAVWTLLTMARSGSAHARYRDQEAVMRAQDASYLATPEGLRSLSDRCGFIERKVLRWLTANQAQQALAELDGPARECAAEPRFTLLRLRGLVDLARFSDAYAVADSLLRSQVMESRYHAEAYYLAGIAAEATGHLSSAEAWLRNARERGYPSCNLPATLGRALARAGSLAEGAAEYDRAAACAPSDPRPRLAAAALWLRSNRPDRAASDLAAARALPLAPEQRRMAAHLTTSLQTSLGRE